MSEETKTVTFETQEKKITLLLKEVRGTILVSSFYFWSSAIFSLASFQLPVHRSQDLDGAWTNLAEHCTSAPGQIRQRKEAWFIF